MNQTAQKSEIRLAINGYGRIGQSVLRALYENHFRQPTLLDGTTSLPMKLVAINELSDIETIAYLTRYDTTHGRFSYPVNVIKDSSHLQPTGLRIGDDEITVSRQSEIDNLPWQQLDIDLVLECTGIHSDRQAGEAHRQAGAKAVLFSQPATPDMDKTIVYGVNHRSLSADDQIFSNSSCTTNAVVPVIQALHQALTIEQGTITTIHSAMNDQPIIDAYHNQDLRRTRSAMNNVVPVDTGLAKGIDRLLPELEGRFTAVALRVPTINVSAIDLTVYVSTPTDQASVNQILKTAAEHQFDGVLGYTEEPLASSDFNHDPRSGIVDGGHTRVSGNHLVKVLIWFDNEWGFANRMLDVAKYWASQRREES